MTSTTATVVCINDSIVKAASYCLNESVCKQYYNVLEINNNSNNDTSSSLLLLKSDVDPQLLIHLSLLQTFKLATIIIGLPGDSTCPSIIKLYANQGNMSFSDVSGKVIIYNDNDDDHDTIAVNYNKQYDVADACDDY